MVIIRYLIDFVVGFYPGIRKDLYISNMDYTLDKFVTMALILSIIATLVFCIPIGWMIYRMFNTAQIFIIIFVSIIIFITCFIIMINLPYFNKQALGKKIEAEVAVTGRRLLIQLESGKSLINSIIDVAKYKNDSNKALERVAYELYMGKPLEVAIQEAIDNSPSVTFRKIFIQIRNSLKTGSDLKHTLKAALEDITREKTIQFESFGKRLSPLGLFYMIFGTIGPSLGIVIVVIFLTVINVAVKGWILVGFLFVILIIQFFFIMVFSGMRPELEI